MLFQLALKTLKQGKGIRCSACKSRYDFVMVKPAYLASARLGDDSTQGHLAVTSKRDLISASG
jgi:hypothetical protein